MKCLKNPSVLSLLVLLSVWPYSEVNLKCACGGCMCVSAAASFVSSTTGAAITWWQKHHFQDHGGKGGGRARRRYGDEPHITVENHHLYLHVQILLCGNLPYSCFSPPCHLLLLKPIHPRLSPSLRRTVHEEHF